MINIGIGIGWAKALYSVVNNIIANFKARVLSYPNSIFEAGPCLDTTLEELNAIGLLDNASIIVTPNAYNEGILYDVVPNTPLGDMDVVRATTATRVNSLGLIEVVPRNLLQYSEQFDNAVWQKVGATVTENSTIAPNGTSTADKIVLGPSSYIVQPITATYTASCYVKGTVGEIIRFGIGSNVGVGSLFTFNGEWQRIEYTSTTPEGNIFFSTFFGLPITEFFVWGAQAENFATATEYFPTTTRLNIPRIDYTNGSCPSLLVEPQRTNLVFPSLYATLNATYTVNNAISPSGNMDAFSFLPNANSFSFITFGNINSTQQYTFSIYLKGSVNGQKLKLYGDTNDIIDTFTLTTNWARYTKTFTAVSGLQNIYLLSSNYFTPAENNLYYGYGAQLEQGSYATSYIPTVASTVTRNADVISKTGISSLINSQEGVMFIEASALANNSSARFIELNENLGSLTNTIYFRYEPTNNEIAFTVFANGALQCNISYFLANQTDLNKMAFVWALNRFEIWVNGNKVVEDNIGTTPAINTLNKIIFNNTFSVNPFDGKLKSLQLYKNALTNTELAQLTTI